MPATIHEVLDDLRATALDKRDQGDKFERLIRAHLRTDPEWTAKFSDVWLWTDWPERAGRPDTGIDLVAKNRDDEGYTAIQCKFYAADSTVAKADIDSFLSASSRPEFTQRYIFDTARAWSRNATSTLEGLSVPAQRVDIGYLDDINLDWSDYWWSTPPVAPPHGCPSCSRPVGAANTGTAKTLGLRKVGDAIGLSAG
jgi:predicted helicase